MKPHCLLLMSNPETYKAIQDCINGHYDITWKKDGLELSRELPSQCDIIVASADFYHGSAESILAKRNEKMPSVPIIFMTANAEQSEKFAGWALQNGVSSVLTESQISTKLLARMQLLTQLRCEENSLIAEQDQGDLYNRLRTHYPNTQLIIEEITSRGLTKSQIKIELDKKDVTGHCLFDQFAS